jgi:two-component system sensor histidine kinase/response regulator
VNSLRSSPASPTAPNAESRLKSEHAGQRVLLADDNPIIQDVTRDLLSFAGLVVDLAGDGQQAVALALANDYDLILMDVQMPVMDGTDAARQIRSRASRRMPIIALTGNAQSDDRAACLAAGMDDHVAKPVDPQRLFATMLRGLAPVEPASARVAAPAPLTSLERLSRIEGFDVNRAMRNFGGYEAILAKTLARFVHTYGVGLPPLLQYACAEDAVKWSNTCHSVGGACATIGATHLQALLLDLERRVDAVADVSGLAQQGQQVHEAMLTFVNQLDDAIRTL